MTDIATAPPEEAGLVPGWLQRLAAIGWRLLVTIALGLVLLEIAVLLSTVTVSILVAAIVAATFAPFVLALRKRGWSRIKAAAAVFLGAAAVIIATLVIIAMAFIPYIAAAIEKISSSLTTLEARLADVNVPPEVGHAVHRATEDLQAWVSTHVSGVASDVGVGRDGRDPRHVPDVLLPDGR